MVNYQCSLLHFMTTKAHYNLLYCPCFPNFSLYSLYVSPKSSYLSPNVTNFLLGCLTDLHGFTFIHLLTLFQNLPLHPSFSQTLNGILNKTVDTTAWTYKTGNSHSIYSQLKSATSSSGPFSFASQLNTESCKNLPCYYC